MGAKLEGVKQLERGVKDWLRKLGDKAERGIKKASIHILNISQELVPVETGVLAATGRTDLNTDKGIGLLARGFVSYGTQYALRVHEDYSLLHGSAFNAFYAADIAAGRINSFSLRKMTLKKPEEQMHYLSEPLQTEADVVAGIITKEMLTK